jgi:hypothetical protein
LVDTFPIFLQNYFEARQVAACCSSKELCAKPRNVSTNRKRAIALSYPKAFGVKRLRTFKFKIK